MPSADVAVAPRRSRVALASGGASHLGQRLSKSQRHSACNAPRDAPEGDSPRQEEEEEEGAAPDGTDPRAISGASRHEHGLSVASKSSDASLLPPPPPLSSSIFSGRLLAHSLPIQRRHKRQHDDRRGRSQSRTLVNPLVGAGDDTESTASSSSTFSTRSNAQGEAQTRLDLPVLRYKYVARNASVLVGSRWRLQSFQERTVELRTDSAPCLLLYPIASDGEREIIGHDTQMLPLDTTCQLTSSRTGGGGVLNGLKLRSDKENRAFRVRIRFATAADAVVWCKIVQDALRHARWSRHLVPVASLSSAISTASTYSGSRTRSTTSSFTPGHSSKVALYVHLATRKQFVVKSLGKSEIDCNEIQILKKLWSAPSASARDLVSGFRVVETASEVRVIMPKLPGDTLLQFLQNRPKPWTLTELEARLLIGGLCQRLQAVHASGIVHCDLKLENIMLTDVANARIIDFGGAFDLMSVTDVLKGDGRSSSRSGVAASFSSSDAIAMVGTPGYIAPERIVRPLDPPLPRADVFSLGVVLFQLLTGQHPFTEATKRKRALKLRDSLALDWTKAQTLLIMRGVSLEGRQLLQRMFERDPTARITVDGVLASPWMANSCGPKLNEVGTRNSEIP